VDPLLAEYREQALAHRANSTVDAKKANAAYAALQQVLKRMVGDGVDYLLFELYEDPNIGIQAWAAAHTLELDEARAQLKLEEISKAGVPLISSGSRITLEEWKKGNIRFR
jgi:hypothetical protein